MAPAELARKSNAVRSDQHVKAARHDQKKSVFRGIRKNSVKTIVEV